MIKDKIKEKLGLPKDQNGLLIYDVFKGQTTKRYTDILLENDPVHVHVPAKFDSQVSISQHQRQQSSKRFSERSISNMVHRRDTKADE